MVRLGCFGVILIGIGALIVVMTRPLPEKQKLLKYLGAKYPQVQQLSEVLSSATAWEGTLCFGEENSDYLIKEFRKITSLPQPEEKAVALIKELIAGPRARGIRTIPAEVQVKGVQRDGETLMVNFSQELITRHPGGSTSEMMTVFSIVNTITMNISDVKRVRLLVEGKPVDTIAGHIDCREPILPQLGLVH